MFRSKEVTCTVLLCRTTRWHICLCLREDDEKKCCLRCSIFFGMHVTLRFVEFVHPLFDGRSVNEAVCWCSIIKIPFDQPLCIRFWWQHEEGWIEVCQR